MKTITSYISLFIVSSLFFVVSCTSYSKVNHAENRKLKEKEINQKIEKAYNKGLPILITEISSHRPNSAGGVDVTIDFINTVGLKPIKYAIFTVIPYNRVGDVVSSTIGRHKSQKLKITGPIKYAAFSVDWLGQDVNGAGHGTWENVWYNHSISCIEIIRIKIIYMDGKTTDIAGKGIKSLLVSGVVNS